MRRPAVAFVVTFALVGCRHREQQPEPVLAVNPPEPIETSNPPAPTTNETVAVTDWSGSWSSDFGIITLNQQGTHVTGQYAYDHGGTQIQGLIEGEVINGQLDFAWSESAGGGGAGHAVFTLSNNGKSFNGTWGKGDSRTSGGSWTGTRM